MSSPSGRASDETRIASPSRSLSSRLAGTDRRRIDADIGPRHDRDRGHHRGLRFRRRCRHPGRLEDFSALGVYGDSVITGAHREEYARRHRDTMCRPSLSPRRSIRCSPHLKGRCGEGSADLADWLIEAVAAGSKVKQRNVVLDPVMSRPTATG